MNAKEYREAEELFTRQLAELVTMGVFKIWNEGVGDEATIQLQVFCNDVFVWGCSDSQPVTREDVPALLAAVKAHRLGDIKWCCTKRNEKPQNPVIDWLKEAGAWDDAMEALPDNKYEKFAAVKIAEIGEDAEPTPRS